MPSLMLNFNKALNDKLSTNLHFFVGIYVRLSKTDENKNTLEQSRSIYNQKEICLNYLKTLKNNDIGIIEYTLIDYYIDDGFSGSNFDRPAFKKLETDIINKTINMVITKDLSRLGRDHIESDKYIEKWFPEHDTRYISILDNIDTFSENTNNEIAPIINWANERHNRETSKKIKKTFRENINKGLFMGSHPPYGLLRDPRNKHKLIPDERVKDVIKDIYDKAIKGWSINKIANYLTDKNIPIPSIHTNSNRGIKTKTFENWDPNTVKDILTNEMYIGNMVQGKTTKLNHKIDKITYIPKEDWVVVKNTHEPIIDKDTFDLVQLILRKNYHISKDTRSFLLKGLLKCRECKHNLSIQNNKNSKKDYTVCNYYKKYSKYKVCTPHRFNYCDIEQLIIDVIRIEINKYVDYKIFTDRLNELFNQKEEKRDIDKLLLYSDRMIKKYNKQLEYAYIDKLNNKIDESLFFNIKKYLNDKIDEENEKTIKLRKESERDLSQPNFDKTIKEFMSCLTSKESLLIRVIEKIEIDTHGNIDIFIKCHQSS